MSHDGLRRHSDRQDRIRCVLSSEHAVHVEFRKAVSEHAGYVMPFPVAVPKRGCCMSVYIRLDGLVEDDGEPSVALYTQLPRAAAAALDAAVVGRGIRRPVEPSGDGETRDFCADRGSRNPVPPAEMPRPANLPSD